MVRLGHYKVMEIVEAYEVSASCGCTHVRFVVLYYSIYRDYADCSVIGMN